MVQWKQFFGPLYLVAWPNICYLLDADMTSYEDNFLIFFEFTSVILKDGWPEWGKLSTTLPPAVNNLFISSLVFFVLLDLRGLTLIFSTLLCMILCCKHNISGKIQHWFANRAITYTLPRDGSKKGILAWSLMYKKFHGVWYQEVL